jgi:hypothetical protein
MSRAGLVRAQRRAVRGERFTAVMAACVRRLPFGLAGIVAPSLLGFAVINLFTFAVDFLLLTALHGGLRWAPEALYMYAAMRWLVFRDVHTQDRLGRRRSRPR